MEITETRIRLATNTRNTKLRAFCNATIDNAIAIRDIRIVEGAKGLFVAMPSRRLTIRCLKCGAKNDMAEKFCNECGSKINNTNLTATGLGTTKLHTDIVHPINTSTREIFQKKIIDAYKQELERLKQATSFSAGRVEPKSATTPREGDPTLPPTLPENPNPEGQVKI